MMHGTFLLLIVLLINESQRYKLEFRSLCLFAYLKIPIKDSSKKCYVKVLTNFLKSKHKIQINRLNNLKAFKKKIHHKIP